MSDWKSIPDLDPPDGGVGWNVINAAKSALIKEFLDQKPKRKNDQHAYSGGINHRKHQENNKACTVTSTSSKPIEI